MKSLLAVMLVLIASSRVRAQPAPPAADGSDAGSGSAIEPTPPPDAHAAAGSDAASTETGSATTPAPPPVEPPQKKKKKKPHDDRSWDDTLQGDLSSDENEPELASRGMRFRWLFQTRYTETYPTVTDTMHFDPATTDGYQTSRLFMRATAKPRDWLRSKLLIDFADIAHKSGAKAVKLAYADIKLTRRVIATVGLFKRRYSLLELLSIADYELADSGPIDSLVKDAELAGRDIGAMLRVDPLPKRRWLSLYLAAMSGSLLGDDARADGQLSGRISSEPIKHLYIGVDGAWRRKGQQVPPGFIPSVGPGKAIAADIRYETKRVSLRGEWLWGDRSDFNHRGDDVNGNGGARTFMGAWAIGSYKVKVDKLFVMPAARVEWLDADREHPVGRRYYFSGALDVLDQSELVKVLLDVSRQVVQPGTIPLGQATGLLDQSATIVNVQLQVKI